MSNNFSDFEMAINPPYKMEIRADFPLLKESWSDVDIFTNLLELVENEKWQDPDLTHVNIIYPQKDPERFPNYDNSSDGYIYKITKLLSYDRLPVEIIFRDDIFETMHLNRSAYPSLLSSLTARQIYTMPKCDIKEGGIFASERFILCDHCTDKGGTFANMQSFVEYNGGKVLGAITGGIINISDDETYSLQQCEPTKEDEDEVDTNIRTTQIPREFLKAGHNNKRVKHLATAFVESAKRSGKETTPAKSIVAFEKMLNKHGNSVFALTDKECLSMIFKMTKYGSERFIDTLVELNETKPYPWVKTPPYSPLE